MSAWRDLRERFSALTAFNHETGCLEWQGSRNPRGYGRFSMGHARNKGAHRIAWLIAHGSIPAGMDVLHACDNPPCVLIDHLFLGTQADNMADMTAKGRRVLGERVGSAKLRNAQVPTIRAEFEAGLNKTQLARRHGVQRTTIVDLLAGRTWRSVPTAQGALE